MKLKRRGPNDPLRQDIERLAQAIDQFKAAIRNVIHDTAAKLSTFFLKILVRLRDLMNKK